MQIRNFSHRCANSIRMYPHSAAELLNFALFCTPNIKHEFNDLSISWLNYSILNRRKSGCFFEEREREREREMITVMKRKVNRNQTIGLVIWCCISLTYYKFCTEVWISTGGYPSGPQEVIYDQMLHVVLFGNITSWGIFVPAVFICFTLATRLTVIDAAQIEISNLLFCPEEQNNCNI